MVYIFLRANMIALNSLKNKMEDIVIQIIM